jgi:hypothetical protein
MKPGDVLIGGYGIDERADKSVHDEKDPEPIQDAMNLELSEGSDVNHKRDNKNNNIKSEGLKTVKHKTEVLSDDLTKKEKEIAMLKATLSQLNDQKAVNERLLQEEKQKQDDIRELLKTQNDQLIQKANEEYTQEVSKFKDQSVSRIGKVHSEEKRIHQRKSEEIKESSQKLKQYWESEIGKATHALAQAEMEVEQSKQRREDISEKDRSSWKVTQTLEMNASSLRARLMAMKEELDAIRSHDDNEEQTIANLSAQLRNEESTKNILETRLKQIQMREQILKEKERDFEVENANLHHQVDETENQAQLNAEIVANARNVLEDGSVKDNKLSEKEKDFESLAFKAAQDEITRLKEGIEQKERREAHEEEELLRQATEVRDTTKKAEAISEEASKELAKGETEVEHILEVANAEAQQIRESTKSSVEEIRKKAKSEKVQDKKKERDTTVHQQKELESRIKVEEVKAREMGTQVREKGEEKVEKVKEENEKALDQERDELIVQVKSANEKVIAAYKKEFEEKMTDVEADVVMAKIHSDKNKQEIDQLKHQNELISKQIQETQVLIDAATKEWEFQQFVQSQHGPTFADSD